MIFRKKPPLRRPSPPYSPTTIDPSAHKQRRSLKIFFLGIAVLVLGSLGWVATSGYLAFKNISAKNSDDRSSFFRFDGQISPDQLRSEGDSRINILSLGIDQAAGLTDSIEVISIDPINKTMGMLSIPRDLYVFNSAENRQTKINEVYNSGQSACLSPKKTCDPKVDAGGALMKKTVSDTLGVPISYFARIDFEGVKKIVDSLGGIQIYVDKAISDPKYPNRSNTGYDPFSIKAGLQKLNGETALKYARSRQTTSDFDRSRRQQQVISAIREKAFQLNFLANPKKVTDMITAVGRSFKTDLQSNEIVSLVIMVQAFDGSKTTSAVLDNGPNGPLISSVNSAGQYVLIPKLGETDWTDVQDFAQTALPEPYLVKEAAKIKIVNASGKATNGELLKKKLTSLGYTVSSLESATSGQVKSTISYSTDQPYTLALLKKRLKLTPTRTKEGPTGFDIVITLGSSFVWKK
ncbi:MAG: LCP family protein [Patescibacteria group bacterium]